MYISPLNKKYPKTDPNEPNWRRPIYAMLLLVFVLSILPFIYTGTFSRYQADDYCFSHSIIQNGYFGAISDWYDTTSNRFSTMIVIGLIDPMRVVGMKILPGALITGMVAGLYLLLNKIRILIGLKIGKSESFILAAMATFFTIYAAPDQFQSFYWRSGSITYTLPVVILPFLLTLLIQFIPKCVTSLSKCLYGIVLFILFFFNGGFSETTAAFQATILGILILWVYFRNAKETKNTNLILLFSAIAGIIAAMVIMILSPANAARLKNMPETPGLIKLIYLSFRFAAGFIVNTIESSPLPLAVNYILAFVLAFLGKWDAISTKKWRWLLWAIPLAAFMLVVAVCAPSAYGESAYAEARAFLPAHWILIIAGTTWFYLMGIIYQQWRSTKHNFQIKKAQSLTAVIVVLLCFYPMRGALVTLGNIPNYEARAKAWDERAAKIEVERSAGHLEVEVQALDSYGRIRELSDNPKLWVNRCAAVYYGVQKITAK